MRVPPFFALGLTAVGALLLGSGTGGASDTAAGKKLFLDHKCNACHAVAAQDIAVDEKADAGGEAEEGEGGKAPSPPDLSGVGEKHKAEWIDGYLRKKEMIEGRKHKRRFSGTPEEREALVAWLATLKDAAPDAAKSKGK